jgi:CRP-like cAMP-binding protein
MNEATLKLEDRMSLLKQIPVFASLTKEALSELGTLLFEMQARAQEPLFRKGDQGDKMYILVEGEVRIHDGNHVITRLGPGNVFGEFALIDEETRSASVTTEKACLLLYLDKNVMVPLMGKYPEILKGLLHTQIKRMRDMNDLKEKLAKSYLKISKQNEEIAQQNTSIIEKNQLVEAQNQELRQLNEQKRQLMSVLIHGLKNPLTSALMMVDLLEQHVENKAAVQEYLEVLIHSMQRMDKVFNNIIRDNQRE